MNKKLKESIKEERIRMFDLLSLQEEAQKHPNYTNVSILVESRLDHQYYESGTIVGISPTREGFDDLHENYSDLYRGGFIETKLGDDYIIYGFEFD